MKRIVLTWVLASALCAGVSAQKKKEVYSVVNVNYCLPKVEYRLEITMECTRSVPGPYWKHAEKELGMTPKIVQQTERWRVKGVEIRPQYLPDEKATYAVSAHTEYTPVTLQLSAEGFLAGVASAAGGAEEVWRKEGTTVFEPVQEREEGKINILNLRTYNHLKEVLDSNYTFHEVDGEMKRIWDPIVRYSRKSEVDNVKEAVSEIFRIRSERVKLLNAENGVPDGKSLEIILDGYERMEDDYLSLFMGKTMTREVKRVVVCAPGLPGEAVIAFRFSEKEGLVDVKNVSAQAYALQVADVVVPASRSVSDTGDELAIYYRVPAVGELQLVRGNHEVVLRKRAIVPQFGEIKRFPVEVIANEGLSLEFYPQYGALKSVKKR